MGRSVANRALREQAGLSQTDLAKLLKTSQQQISRLESPRLLGPLAQYAPPRRQRLTRVPGDFIVEAI
jgi:transcriptional regulator with XRE-family HTH domain